jgi:predicted transcriptional regulator
MDWLYASFSWPWLFPVNRSKELLQFKETNNRMKLTRRDKLKIYGDLLAVLNDEASDEKIVLTWVSVRMKVSFDRLKKYIAELVELGLVEDEVSLKLTEKGKRYLKEYGKVLAFMEDMGLSYR